MRWILWPYFGTIEKFVPKEGFIIDLGCGYGYFAHFLYNKSQKRKILGIDIIPERISAARKSVRDSEANPGIDFRLDDVRNCSLDKASAIIMFHLIYLLTFEEQKLLFFKCF